MPRAAEVPSVYVWTTLGASVCVLSPCGARKMFNIKCLTKKFGRQTLSEVKVRGVIPECLCFSVQPIVVVVYVEPYALC